MLCPACENESENTHQCQNCGWQFVNFTQEPTEKEQNEYTSLLQNYRTELYFNLAQQYYQNKQFEETIQCCLISCEHQLFDNPLALLASSYKELENNEEALKYTNMALEINPNNEMAKQLLTELNIDPEQSKEIIKLTPKILKKGMFETTEEYQNRIKNLGYVEIGTISLDDYDADNQLLSYTYTFDSFCKEISFFNLKNLSDFSSLLGFDNTILTDNKYAINIPKDKAKDLYDKSNNYTLLAEITNVKDNVCVISSLKFENYIIDNILLDNSTFWKKKYIQNPSNPTNCARLINNIESMDYKCITIYNYLIYLYAKSGDESKAKEIFEYIIQILPTYIPAYINFVGILTEYDMSKDENSLNKAITYLNQAIKINPSYSLLYEKLTMIYLALKEDLNEMVYAEKAIQYNSSNLLMYSILINSYLKNKDFNAADSYYEMMNKVDLNNWLTHKTKGEIYFAKGDIEQALKFYALGDSAMNRINHYGYGSLCQAYRSEGNIKEAIKYCEKVVEIDPQSVYSNILKELKSK